MPLFNSAEIKMSSGAAGSTTQFIERVQTVGVNYSPPRISVSNLGRFKPLTNRPVVNYTPVSISVDAIKSSKEIEINWGLLNSTGVGMVFANPSNNIAGFGCRNFEVLIVQPTSNVYQGQINVSSGCLSSYSVSASVGEPARVSFSAEGLDLSMAEVSTTRMVNNYETTIVKPENVSVSGIDFSGFGITGLSLQNFNLSLSIGRQSLFQLGTRFPNRPVTEINASLSVNGFLEGISYFSGLRAYDCGNPYTGTLYFTLVPSCSGGLNGTTYILVNPTLDSFSLGASVGSFTSVDLSFSAPISIVSGEAINGSNLIIQ